MLEELAALAPQPLTLVLERDGAYPPIDDLLLELPLAGARRGEGGNDSLKPRPGQSLPIAMT